MKNSINNLKIYRKTRPTIFVCSSINATDGRLISKAIEAKSISEASRIFYNQYNCRVQEVLGPFYKKRANKVNAKSIKFLNEPSKLAIYQQWLVQSFSLKEPMGYVYLTFVRHMVNEKASPPRGITIVPINDLREYEPK